MDEHDKRPEGSDKLFDMLVKDGFEIQNAVIGLADRRFYAYPKKGIYQITKSNWDEYCERIMKEFLKTVKDASPCREDHLKGWWMSSKSELTFAEGGFYDWEHMTGPLTTTSPKAFISIPCDAPNEVWFRSKYYFELYFHPSKEFAGTFLDIARFGDTLATTYRGPTTLTYESLAGKRFSVSTNPSDDKFWTQHYHQDVVHRFSGMGNFRNDIELAINADMRRIGASYTLNPGFRSEKINVERYNAYFRKSQSK